MKSTKPRRDQETPLFLGYLLLQWIIVAGLSTPEYSDSKTYMHLSLTGSAVRLPTVPLLYKILPTDPLRIAGQTLLAAVAWWVLASVASRLVIDRRTQIGVRAVLLMLGVVAPIASWNSVILSESTAISLTALLIAAWLHYSQNPRWQTAGAAVLATLFWTFTRQPNVLSGLMITAGGVVAAIVGRGSVRLRASVSVALIVISAAGLIELHRNQTLSRGALEYILHDRVLPNSGYTAWFARHGMPNPRFDPAAPSRAVPQNPAFTPWLDARGESTYIRFAATHSTYTLLDPLRFFSGEKASVHHPNRAVVKSFQPNPTPSLLSPTVRYGRERDVLPSPVEQLLFDQGQIGDLILLAGLGAGLAWLGCARFGRDRRLLLPALIAASSIPQGYIIWLSGGEATHELDRLSMVNAVSVRIGLWIVLALAVDRVISSPGTTR